jgi:glycosidase
LGDKFQKGSTRTNLGTKDELLRMIAVLHANGIEVIQDVVLNHVNSAGSSNGSGGQDPAPLSMATNSGFKNFRYVSFSTPASTETQTNYWNRTGRWPKNFTNFYPNPSNNCTSGDICTAWFGPDISYENTAFGPSSNVVGFNPAQSSGYMRNEGRNWMMWMKKQTGVDGFRWDAVKHFPTFVQEDFSYNVKYLLPTWSRGGESMFNVGEWVGGKSELDNYVNAIASSSGEKMMGAFDFGLRAFDSNGGLYGMVYGMGNFNMASLPGAQQNERVHFYSNTNTYIHRTVPFVNNHDTFRPQVSSSGNYTGWNASQELSAHIEPNEPRLSAAYAVIMAMDGNPQIFFEDLFDIGYSGNRYTHDPKSTSSLISRGDLLNLLWCHQNLDFKSGAYQVPHSNADYLVIARAGRAVIGITDSWSNWQNQWVYTGFAPGTVLKDYSGANGTATVTVNADGWAPINTPPVNPALNTAGRRGYSVWAPVGKDGSVYQPPRGTSTTQEWEMANDLGDNHPSSLRQGGALPAGSTNFRTAGKIFVENGRTVTYILYPEQTNRNLFIGLYNNSGTLLSNRQGIGTLTGTYVPNFTGWVTIRVRNGVTSNPQQRCWVNVTYTAPAIVPNAMGTPALADASVWSGNGGTDEWTAPENWEEGLVPHRDSRVVIPANAFPFPTVQGEIHVNELIVEDGARIYMRGQLETIVLEENKAISGEGRIKVDGEIYWQSEMGTALDVRIQPNPGVAGDFVQLIGSGWDVSGEWMTLRVWSSDGRLCADMQGTTPFLNNWLSTHSAEWTQGLYTVQLVSAVSQGTARWVLTR